MSSWVATLIYARAGHLSIIGLRFSTRVFIFIIRRGMCMWRRRCPKNPCQAAAKAESKAVEQFNMRGCADQEDDALLSCACAGENTHFQVWGKWASSSSHASIRKALYSKRKYWHLSHPSHKDQVDTFLHIREVWLLPVLQLSVLLSSFSFRQTWELSNLSPFSEISHHQICRDVRSLLPSILRDVCLMSARFS